MEPDFPCAHVVILAYVQGTPTPDALADIQRWQRTTESCLGPGRCWPTSMAVRCGYRLQARSALERLQVELVAAYQRGKYFFRQRGHGRQQSTSVRRAQVRLSPSICSFLSLESESPLRSPRWRSPISRATATGRACPIVGPRLDQPESGTGL